MAQIEAITARIARELDAAEDADEFAAVLDGLSAALGSYADTAGAQKQSFCLCVLLLNGIDLFV